MDFIIGLPQSHDFTVIMVVMDRLLKSTHFDALPTHFTTTKIIIVFNDIVVKHHGFSSVPSFQIGIQFFLVIFGKSF